ncbi:YifB family Mg chelatase-like AAA ATPase [bacterium]|nr:YifB family Mg chelatase-like AAA ATPase [bacterium]
MISKVFSSATVGVDAYKIEVETHLEKAIPNFIVVGLPDGAVKESRERVSAAIKNSAFVFPTMKITVNLAPADIRKEGSSFDLPIAIGILAASNQVIYENLKDTIILGELSLDGSIRSVKGVLPITINAKKDGFKKIILPKENATEAAIVEGIDVFPVSSLVEVVEFLNACLEIKPCKVSASEILSTFKNYKIDFSDVKGQAHAKRALEVAASGGHNVLMLGPPGSGKTMLAKRLPTILPDLTLEESLETTKIYSVSGLLPSNQALISTRPFRSPHHTISDAGLVGGSNIPKPGEISLAHHGVLFLDELPEFKKSVLEVMRQPLEDGKVTISRATLSLTFPANFLLVASMNPCPCGYFGSSQKECTCNPPLIQKYFSKVSGPLLDRIDIQIEVPAVPFKELSQKELSENSETISQRVIKTRKIQTKRFENEKGIFANSDMTSKLIRKFCQLDTQGEELLKIAITKLGLSARAYDRILKVSRTIADLESSEKILPQHLGEAIQYRSLDRNIFA